MDNVFQVDLNSDLGESFGNYKIAGDADIIRLVSSANVACGCHAGDPVVMDATILRAKEAGIRVGAHPGYPDMQGFGRRNMALSPEEARAYVIYQIGALQAFCRRHDVKLQHVKPHGALYNAAAKDPALAKAIAEGICSVDPDLILMGLAGGELIKAGREAGLRVAEEVFADRAYEEDGTLRARTYPDALIRDEEEAVSRVIRMIQYGEIEAVNGKIIPIRADSICVHGDGEKALKFVEKIRARLIEEEIKISPLQDFIK